MSNRIVSLPAFKEEHQTTTPPRIAARGVRHWFGSGATRAEVLRGVDLEIQPGEFVVLMGPSGSGKTTLLTLVGALRSLQAGSIQLDGRELFGANQDVMLEARRRIGFIFQAHNLHASLTALQNVRMALDVYSPAQLKHRSENSFELACRQSLESVGLGEHCQKLPSQLSGGQKQRVAIARAIVSSPPIILADEPTAALDGKTAMNVVGLLRRMANQRATSIILVTHDHRILDHADRILRMEDGCILDTGFSP